MSNRYIDVVVEEHPEIPEGCEMRFHAVGDSRVVRRIQYEPLTGPGGQFAVTAAGGEPALATPVDDSGAGTAVLICGDARGVRLWRVGTGGETTDGAAIAEPYLLLSEDAIVE